MATSSWKSGAAHAAASLGSSIIGGEFGEGTRLPLEAELASRLDVSRNTLREAMKLLEAKALVRIAPRRGTVVEKRSHWNLLDPEVLEWSSSLTVVNPDFLRELAQARHAIEPAAAAEVARSGADAEIGTIAAAYRAMADLPAGADIDAKVEADVRFHLAVADASNNRFLRSIMRSIMHAVRVNFAVLIAERGNYEGNLANHRRVLEAITRRDPDAARLAMEAVLDTSRANAERLFGQSRAAGHEEKLT